MMIGGYNDDDDGDDIDEDNNSRDFDDDDNDIESMIAIIESAKITVMMKIHW